MNDATHTLTPTGDAAPQTGAEVSIIVPLFNEERNVRPLYEAVVAAMEGCGRPFEMICVNDGSTDGTQAELDAIAADPRIKVVTFRRNFGQTAATMAGIDHAGGPIIVPIDGDLQNDPADIPMLLARLEEGFDVVSGWRKDRQDHALRRTLPSRLANILISRISGVHLHDYGCTLKAYRRDILEGIRLYGEMHRFVPIYVSWRGGRVCEMPVRHHPRRFGRSKYGARRVAKVLLDLILIKFLADFHTRPIHVFGGFGLVCFAISLLAGLYAIYLRLFEHVSFIQTPLPLLVVMTFITGVLCILLGLLAEILVRIYYESQSKPAYDVKSRRNLPGYD